VFGIAESAEVWVPALAQGFRRKAEESDAPLREFFAAWRAGIDL
jgi:hypothetical protein